jgi:hypothetical protein
MSGMAISKFDDQPANLTDQRLTARSKEPVSEGKLRCFEFHIVS